MISVGNIKIGNRNFIPVQTMLKNPVCCNLLSV